MGHGRSIAWGAWLLAAIAAMVCGAKARQVEEPAQGKNELHLTWAEADHPSGIYHVKSDATLTVLIDNTSKEAVEIGGEILFGTQEPAKGAPFKTISVTPVSQAALGAGQRAKVPLKVTFAAAGTYALRWKRAGGGGDSTEIIENGGGGGVAMHFRAAQPADEGWRDDCETGRLAVDHSASARRRAGAGLSD